MRNDGNYYLVFHSRSALRSPPAMISIELLKNRTVSASPVGTGVAGHDGWNDGLTSLCLMREQRPR